MTKKFNIRLSPSGVDFDAPEGLTILQAALNSGMHLGHSCQNGRCGVCKARVLRGEIAQPLKLEGITDEERKDGYILTCCARPISDLDLQAIYYPQLDNIKTGIYPCKLVSLEFPVPDVAVLKLKLPPSVHFHYLAGQYIDLIIKGERRSYSIANTANMNKEVELHVRKNIGGLFSNIIFNELDVNQLLSLEGPFGTFFVRECGRPIIFLSGGTGFAPVKAMVETLLHERTGRRLYIYWGMNEPKDFYYDIANLCGKNNNVKFIQVVSGDDLGWQGRKGLVHKAVLDDFEDLSGFDVYACGSTKMVEVARADFVSRGLLPDNFYADAFIPAV